MADGPEHDDDFAASAMRAMFDSADVSIQRDGGTQVVKHHADVPPVHATEPGQRETAGSFSTGASTPDPQVQVQVQVQGGSSATALALASLVFAIALASAVYVLL